MPTKPKRYPKQIPLRQFQIIKEIALAGMLSNVKLAERLEVSHPVVSDAVKVLVDRGIIESSHIETVEHQDGKPEKYYALTKMGFDEFINGNLTPEEFFEGLLKTYKVRQMSGWLSPMNDDDFENHYKLFEQKYLGTGPNRAYLEQSPFFNKLYEQWLAEYRPRLFEQSHLRHITNLIYSPLFEECYDESLKRYDQNGITIVQKVLECLAINRSITERQLIEDLKSKQDDINNELAGKASRCPDFIWDKVKDDYEITEANIKTVINRHALTESFLQELRIPDEFDYSKIMRRYLDFLSHLVVSSEESVDGPRYELSLFGIALILAIITHPRQMMFYGNNRLEKNPDDLIAFYNTVSQNYADKLPLVFGKWALLTDKCRNAYQWFLPVLYQNVMDEFARAKDSGSVSIILGGVKEYQETMHEIAFHAATRLFDLYRGISSVLHHVDVEDVSPLLDSNNESGPISSDNSDIQLDGNNKAWLSALEKKQNELAALLRYIDLWKFVDVLDHDRDSTTIGQHMKTISGSELSIIEKVLASEITFLFYINLARNRFIDYTDEGRNFLGDERDTDYKDTAEYHILRPADYLRAILGS